MQAKCDTGLVLMFPESHAGIDRTNTRDSTIVSWLWVQRVFWSHGDMIHPINLQFLTNTPNAIIHAGRRDWAWDVLQTPQPGPSTIPCCPAVCEQMASTSSLSYSSGKDGKERSTALKAHQELLPGSALHFSLKMQPKGHSHQNHTEQISLDGLKKCEHFCPMDWEVKGRRWKKVAPCSPMS